MDRQIKGLRSISTLRKLQQGAIPGNNRGSDQLQLYILENNRALLEKELESVLQRKAKIEERMKMIDENMATIKGGLSGRKRRKKGRPSVPKAQSPQKSIQVMKIDY